MNKNEIFDYVCRKLCQYMSFNIHHVYTLCIFNIKDDPRSLHSHTHTLFNNKDGVSCNTTDVFYKVYKQNNKELVVFREVKSKWALTKN